MEVAHEIVAMSSRFATRIDRLCAANAASPYSKPKRVSRSRYSTRMTPTCGSQTCPMRPLRCPFIPELTSLTALTIRNGLLESQLGEPKPTARVNPLFDPHWTPARRGPPRRVVNTRHEQSPFQLATALWERANALPAGSAKPSCSKHPAAWPTHSTSFGYAPMNSLRCAYMF